MVTTTNLTSYWKSDDNTASTVVLDAHGSDNGTAARNTSLFSNAVGLINRSLDFDGSSDYFLASSFPYSSTGSISFWFNADSVSNSQLIDSDTSEQGINIQIFSSKVYARVDAESFINYGTTLSTNTWYHCVFTWDGTGHKLYLNAGTPVTQSNATTPTTPIGFKVGATQAGASFFNGRIDEIGVWAEALTAQSVSDLYNSGSGLAYPFVAATVVSPSAITLSTSEQSPNYFIDITKGPVELTTSISMPTVIVPTPIIIYPSTVSLTLGLPIPIITSDAIQQQIGTIGTKYINTNWPIEEGLIATTTRQTTDPNLRASEEDSF